jgi:hypothetical protein
MFPRNQFDHKANVIRQYIWLLNTILIFNLILILKRKKNVINLIRT